MLHENIKTIRKAKGLSQEELAIKLHVVRQTVSKWEKGISTPDAGMLIQIADVLDTTVHVLLGEVTPVSEDQEAIKAIAAKLEILNEKLAKRSARNGKIWRALFLVIGLFAMAGVVHEILHVIHLYQAQKMLEDSVSIIGGVDKPTGIYISNISERGISRFITATAGIVAVLGLYHTRGKS